MTRPLPFWKFYPADYFAETPDLTVEQHGVLLLLLFTAWQRGGAIPNDPAFIKRALESRAAGMHGNRYNRLVPPLLQRFFTLDAEGNWRRDRLEKDLESARNFSENQQENANKRWAKTRKNKQIVDAVAMPARASSYSQSESNNARARTKAIEHAIIWKDTPQAISWAKYEGKKDLLFVELRHPDGGLRLGTQRPSEWPPTAVSSALQETLLGATQ